MGDYKVLFSDLDGTLIHYPNDFQEYATIVREDRERGTATLRYNASGVERDCVVLSSLTGGDGYLSLRTIGLVDKLRSIGVVFAIITGARSSTYEKRRSRLPNADYEFYENGGRKLVKGVLDATWTDTFEKEIGPIADRTSIVATGLPKPEERQGTLWELYNVLSKDGWILDARDYSTNFRVDVKKTEGKEERDLHAVLNAELGSRGLSSSYNLGKADVYPKGSGKANAAAHILSANQWSPEQAIAMFDDDNDLEMGALVGRSYLPGVTHPSVLEAMKKHKDKWVLTKSRGVLGTEEALEAVLELCGESAAPTASVEEPTLAT